MAVNALKQLSSSIKLEVENRLEDLKFIVRSPIAAQKKKNYLFAATPCWSAGCSPFAVQLPLEVGGNACARGGLGWM